QQSARTIHLAEMKQQGVVAFRQIEYSRIRLCVPRLDQFQDIQVLGLVTLLLWYSVKELLIGRGSDEVVLPIAGAFVDVSVKGQIEDRTVGETAHDGHAEAHQPHLALLVIAAGYFGERGYHLSAELIGIGTRSRVTEDSVTLLLVEDRNNGKLLSPFLNIAGLPDVRTHQDVGIMDVIRSQVREPHRKFLGPSLVFLDRSVNPV